MSPSNIIIFAAICSSAFATVIFRSCEEYPADICDVKQVRVIPCIGANNCIIRKRDNVTIAIDFTPNFSAQNLQTSVSWNAAAMFQGDEEGEEDYVRSRSDDACKYTHCPVETGETQTLTYTMSDEDYGMPVSNYQIIWKAWNKENEEDMCCFQAHVTKLRRKIVVRKSDFSFAPKDDLQSMSGEVLGPFKLSGSL